MNNTQAKLVRAIGIYSFFDRHFSLFSFTLLALTVFLLSSNVSHASVNKLPNFSNQLQTSIQSFHETTELAETVWTDLTSNFITLYEQGDFQNALLVAQRSHTIAETNFGLNDVNTADALLKLGIIQQTLGRLNEAEDHLLGSLVILEDQLSPDHPDIAVIMTNLGNVYYELERLNDSEKYHRQALTIRENAFGDSDPSVAQSNYNLAVLFESKRDYERAANFYRTAIDTWTVSLGPTHPYIGNALNNLSNVYNLQGKYKLAAAVLQRMVAFKKSVFGAQHEEVAQSLISLGSNYLEQGKYNFAGNAYEEALDIALHILGSSDPQLALLMYTLANIYHTQARVEEQKLTTEQASSNNRVQFDNEAVALQSDTDTNTIKTESLFKQAIPLYQKAAEILEKEDTGSQQALDVVLSELSLLYKEMGNNDMAVATESRITTH